MIYDIISRSPEETEAAGARLAEILLEKSDAEPFVALYGDLGVGKTAFVRGMASVIAKGASVHSPTYAIVNTYKGDKYNFYHFDMYRITSDDDLYSVGFYDYTDGIIAAEWCENIPFALPDQYFKVTIERLEDDADMRRITAERIEHRSANARV